MGDKRCGGTWAQIAHPADKSSPREVKLLIMNGLIKFAKAKLIGLFRVCVTKIAE